MSSQDNNAKGSTNQLTLSQIQQEELRIISCFADYCDANNLTYYLAYGSLLGAVRHEGFIPWDDDVDVLMPRKDYEQLSAANPQFDLCGWLEPSSDGHPWCYGKIISHTTYFEEVTCDLRKDYGVFIDVFPLDGANDTLLCRMKFWLVRRIDNLALIAHYYRKEHFAMLPLKKRLFGSLGRLFPKRLYKKIVIGLSKSKSLESSKAALNYCSGYGFNKELTATKDLQNRRAVPFEGIMLYSFDNPIARLEKWYGSDWAVPIKQEQHIHGKSFWRH